MSSMLVTSLCISSIQVFENWLMISRIQKIPVVSKESMKVLDTENCLRQGCQQAWVCTNNLNSTIF